MSIIQQKTFDANFTGSLPFWVDGAEAHKTALMCVNAIESKYQLLNEYKLFFDLIVHQQQHLHCFYIASGNTPVRLASLREISPHVIFIS